MTGDLLLLVDAGRAARQTLDALSSGALDGLLRRLAGVSFPDKVARELAKMALEDTGMGRLEDKISLHQRRILGVMHDLHGVDPFEPVEIDIERGLARYGRPIGIIAVLVPATNPMSTTVVSILLALKTRNAVFFCPHPSVQRVVRRTVNLLVDVLLAEGLPAEIIQVLDDPSRQRAEVLTQAVDLVLATGGAGVIRRAQQSGTPTFSAGVGNAICLIEQSADLAEAAQMIAAGKSFDNGTSCSAESGVLVPASIAPTFVKCLEREGGFVCSAAQARMLTKTLWIEGQLNRAIVGRDAGAIAEAAGFAIEKHQRFLIVNATDAVDFSGEKLCPVLAIWTYPDGNFEAGVERTAKLLEACGRGHSCAVFTADQARVHDVARRVPASRLLINQSTGLGNSGSFSNGLPFSVTLGCGPWGGGVTSENVSWRHLLNYVWVVRPASRRPYQVSDLIELPAH